MVRCLKVVVDINQYLLKHNCRIQYIYIYIYIYISFDKIELLIHNLSRVPWIII